MSGQWWKMLRYEKQLPVVSGWWSDRRWLLITGCLSLATIATGFAGEKKVAAPASSASPSSESQPMTITSNNMEARKKENLVIFKGDVKAEQKDYTLYAKELYVYYVDKEIKETIAIGDVRIVKLNMVATGEKAVHTRDNRTVVLTGNPQAKQDCDIVKGDKITIYLDEDKSLVESGGNNRVKAIVHPKDEKKKAKCK